MNSRRTLAQQLADAADRPGPDLAAPAFLIARLEHRLLDPGPYLDRLDEMGETAFRRIADDPGQEAPLAARVDALNDYVFNELDSRQPRPVRGSAKQRLNEALDRRTGIPITLSLVYIEVARRAGIRAEGINFPGHFLVRALHDLHTDNPGEGLIIDPFHTGAILDEEDCRRLLQSAIGEEAAGPELLARATRRQILVRMLLNLKRLYVSRAIVPTGPIRRRSAAGTVTERAQRAPRPRAAGLPHERFRRRAARSRREYLEALEDGRTRMRSSARRTRKCGST